jgi:hypothetical protein
VSARTDFALVHPLNDPSVDIEPYKVIEPQPDGNLLVTILAVDR